MQAPGQAVIVMALRLYTGTARSLYIHVSLLSLSRLNSCGNASCYLLLLFVFVLRVSISS